MSENPFKEGDYALCVKTYPGLDPMFPDEIRHIIKGKVYKVESVNNWYVEVCNEKGVHHAGYKHTRFELAPGPSKIDEERQAIYAREALF